LAAPLADRSGEEEGVISSFNDFYLPLLHVEEGGGEEGRHPVVVYGLFEGSNFGSEIITSDPGKVSYLDL